MRKKPSIPLSERLKSLREAAGLTQTQFADQSGLSIWTVRNLEQGRVKNPELDTLNAIAKVFGITIDQLVS